MTMPTNKLPPHNPEAEQYVLSACLTRPEIIKQVASVLQPTDFYRDAHTRIFTALEDLGDKADHITLADWLRKRSELENVGGETYISELVESPGISAGWRHHAGIVKDASNRRNLISACAQAADDAQGIDTLDEILKRHKTAIREIHGHASIEDDQVTTQALYTGIWEDLWNEQGEPGLTLGIEGIDGKHYLEPGCSHVVAAESGTGKSAFCLQVADHVANKYGTVLYFSLESTRNKLGIRQLARYSKVALTRLHKRHLDHADDPERLDQAISKLMKSPLILIDNSRYQEVERLVSFCETAAMGQRIHLVVVDYLQLMGTREKYGNRHLEISHIAKKLQFLAKDLNIPIITVSQLGKDVEKRTIRRPTLGDIKESGDIRNQSDNILFLYAPDSSPTIYPVECFLGKGKDQEQFSSWLEFNGNYQEFKEGTEPENHKRSSHWQEK